jgi:hypothetical protein
MWTSIEQDGSSRGFYKRIDNLQERRLTAAGGPHEGDELVSLDCKIHALQRDGAPGARPIRLVHVFDLNIRHFLQLNLALITAHASSFAGCAESLMRALLETLFGAPHNASLISAIGNGPRQHGGVGTGDLNGIDPAHRLEVAR